MPKFLLLFSALTNSKPLFTLMMPQMSLQKFKKNLYNFLSLVSNYLNNFLKQT
jgi:hypothetical protein